jgi:ABC-type multidrug transport system ATPase subunit
MPSIAIEFSQVCKRFGANAALQDIDIAIRTGSCHALAGVNGSGKTTFFNCLLDFLRVDWGHIRVQGTASIRSESRSDMSYLPEKFSLPPFLKGREVIDFLLALGGEQANEGKKSEVCAVLGLDSKWLERPVGQLSKGMAQKLGLATCFISSKQLLVLDEPMSGLDSSARARLRKLIQHRHHCGDTILFSSHAFSDIEQLCDGLTILDSGRVLFHGEPTLLRSTFPAQSLEQSFLRCIDGETRTTVPLATAHV